MMTVMVAMAIVSTTLRVAIAVVVMGVAMMAALVCTLTIVPMAVMPASMLLAAVMTFVVHVATIAADNYAVIVVSLRT